MLAGPIALTILYGTLRAFMQLFTQARDALFAAISMNAVRRLADQVFVHLHRLSLRFHLDRQTGGLSITLAPRWVWTVAESEAGHGWFVDATPMTDTDAARKQAELDRLLNDPDVPMHADRVWSLLAALAGGDRTRARADDGSRG